MLCLASWQTRIFWASARHCSGVVVCSQGFWRGVYGRLEWSHRSALTKSVSSNRSAVGGGGKCGSSSGRGNSRSGIGAKRKRVVPVLMPLRLQLPVLPLQQSELPSSLAPHGAARPTFFVSSQRQLHGGGAGGRRHSGRWLTPALLLWYLRPSSGWPIQIARGGSWITCLSVTWLCAGSARTNPSLVTFVRVWPRR